MPIYKNIKISKRGGGTRLQRVQVLASGKYKFVKNLTRSKSKSKRSKTKTSKRGKTRMTKRKKNKKRNFKVPLATVIGLSLGFVGPMGDSPMEYAMKGDYRSLLVRLGKSYTGFDANVGQWKPSLMVSGLGPLVIGALISKLVGGSPLNVNRKINIPFIKL